jgi:hypothetical protein
MRRRHGALFLAAALWLFLLLISERPVIGGIVLFALMVALLAGGAWYQGLETIRALVCRTRLTIAGILSDGRPRSRNEIAEEAGRQIGPLRFPPVRWLHLPDRALDAMTRRGLLTLSDGRYSAARPDLRDAALK